MKSRPNKLILVRHGQTNPNAEGRLVSFGDPPLNEIGFLQARQVGDRLSGQRVTAIHCSPRLRAIQTAEIIIDSIGLTGVLNPNLDRRLLELGFGTFEGRTPHELAAEGLSDEYSSWRQGDNYLIPPGGEEFEDAAKRAREFFDEVSGAGGEVVVVTHSHLLRIMLVSCIFGLGAEKHRRLKVETGSIIEIEWELNVPRLCSIS